MKKNQPRHLPNTQCAINTLFFNTLNMSEILAGSEHSAALPDIQLASQAEKGRRQISINMHALTSFEELKSASRPFTIVKLTMPSCPRCDLLSDWLGEYRASSAPVKTAEGGPVLEVPVYEAVYHPEDASTIGTTLVGMFAIMHMPVLLAVSPELKVVDRLKPFTKEALGEFLARCTAHCE